MTTDFIKGIVVPGAMLKNRPTDKTPKSPDSGR